MRYRFEQSGDIGTLSFEGSLRIRYAPVLKDILMRAIDNTGHLVLDLKGVAHVDPACLQILCSACRVALSREKRMTLAGWLPEAFQQLPEHSEHFNSGGCCTGSGQACFWQGRRSGTPGFCKKSMWDG